MTIGKKALAEALGWSRNKLERRLRSDPRFPVVAIGDQTGGWEFDLSAVLAHLDGEPMPERVDPVFPRDGEKPRSLHAATDPRNALPRRHAASRSAHHQGEASARQRRDLADAALKEAQLRNECADLVEISEVRTAVATVLKSFHSDLDKLPDLLVAQCELLADAVPVIAKLVGRVRAQLDRNAAPLLGEQRHAG